MKSKRTILFSTALVLCTVSAARAASDSWITGITGSYNDSANWQGGNIPNGGEDTATIEGNGSDVTLASDITLQSLDLALTSTGGAPVFNQTAGILDVGTLRFGGGGGSRNPSYNLGGGTLNITSAFTWGNGNNARFHITGGTVNQSSGSLNVGVSSGSNGAIVMSGGTFNHTAATQVGFGTGGNGTGALIMSGGSFHADSATTVRISNSSGGNASISLSSDAHFSASAATTVYLGNNGGTGSLILSDESVFHAPAAAVSVGQFGTGSGTVTLLDNAGLNALRLVLGGDNAGSSVYGVVNLNGGTIATGGIRLGSTAGDNVPLNVLNANGGTVRAMLHGWNSNFFQNLIVDLQENGLKFDTGGNFVTITNNLSGTGGFSKLGEGILQLNGVSSYSGNTIVGEGELIVDAAWFGDGSRVEIAEDALLNLNHELLDIVGSLVLDGVEHTSGIWGSVESGAPNTSPLLSGQGRLLVGGEIPAGRDLVWSGEFSEHWNNFEFYENFFVEGESDPVSFSVGDNVLFDDRGNYAFGVIVEGTVQPGTVTFDTVVDFTLDAGFGSGIGGGASIVKNNINTLTLGGEASSFSGTVDVNEGRLVQGSDRSFGASSGISIAAGAQVDLNGRQPGTGYTYTLAGPGPDGEGAIVNHGGEIFSSTGIRHLVLLADASIGGNGARFDIGHNGSITGSGEPFTLTKVGTNGIAVRAASTDVNYVIESGTMWAQHNNAFGNSSNVLTVAAGATTGTWGTLAIPVQVILQDGASLANIGSGTGTWTGDVSVDGAFTIGAPQPVVLNGIVSGTASLTKTGGNTLTLGHAPAWTGNTTVSGGTLVLNVEGLADEGDVALGNGAVLHLAHGQTDTVKTLTLNGVPAAVGTWGSSDSTATYTNDTFFQGTGILNVTEEAPSPGGGFATWAASFELEGDDAEPGADPDSDGIPNAVEYVLGGDPTRPSLHLLPQADSSGEHILFTFHRDENSIDGTTSVIVQYGTDLTGWTDIPVPGEPGTSGMVTVGENGEVTVAIPKDGDPVKFARMKVVMN